MASYDERTGEIILSNGTRLMSEGHQSEDEPWEDFEAHMETEGFAIIELGGHNTALVFAVGVDHAYLSQIKADEASRD